MKVAVIGAGAVGGAFAAALCRSGHEVTVTARGEHLTAIEHNGLMLEGEFGDFLARVKAVESLNQLSEDEAAFDLILLCTKAQDAKAAITQNFSVLETADILVVQNGLNGITLAEELLPTASIAGGLAGLATSLIAPGIIRVTSLSTTYIGNDEDPEFAKELVQILDSSIPVEFIDHYTGALWTKLIVNCLNAFPAFSNLSMQELADTPLLKWVALSMQEAVRVALSHRVHFAPLMGIDHQTLRTFVESELPEAEKLPKTLIARFGDVPNFGSTLQSIRRNRQSEISELNGEIVSRAGAIATPVNQAIIQLVHRAERGEFSSVAEALKLFELSSKGSTH
ncbi:MAG: 2-dehydropantoate 2-reductase [Microbacteriaceae bacterium]